MVNSIIYVARGQEMPVNVNLKYKHTMALENPEIMQGFERNGDEFKTNCEPNWDFLREKYGGGVYINRGTPLEWKEITLGLNEDNLRENLEKRSLNLEGRAIDSFTI